MARKRPCSARQHHVRLTLFFEQCDKNCGATNERTRYIVVDDGKIHRFTWNW
jgi:hypothetical protein